MTHLVGFGNWGCDLEWADRIYQPAARARDCHVREFLTPANYREIVDPNDRANSLRISRFLVANDLASQLP